MTVTRPFLDKYFIVDSQSEVVVHCSSQIDSIAVCLGLTCQDLLQNKSQLCCSMLDRPYGGNVWEPVFRHVDQKAFRLNKGVQWQAKLSCLNMCWICVMMVGGTV